MNKSFYNSECCLNNYIDTISKRGILPLLKVENCNLKIYDSVDSTNNVAKEMVALNAEHGTVILANVQTGGRGRYGRSFFSPLGHGIYMTFILRPYPIWPVDISLVTVFTGVVVCEAIESICNVSSTTKKIPQIKWVNDVFLDRKKIGGILTEAVTDESGTLQWIVVGIGINFTATTDLPVELEGIVGSIFDFDKENLLITRNQLAAEIINRMLNPTYTSKEIIEGYRQRLFILGKKVRVEGTENPYEATVLDIDDMGKLLVKNESGDVITLSAGEVSIRSFVGS
ncbi:MAG: biotin--[acetyl-CoA-carboxylase] ligase [Defluviitaleaceae bacterium]|nr:biotin--[acetyl-CoA-carboxylase] ligase [Defluviitaleaceae bacterium]